MTGLPQRLWMRHEVRESERRAPIVPADATTLAEHGVDLTVEESPQRVFPIGDYLERALRSAHASSEVINA